MNGLPPRFHPFLALTCVLAVLAWAAPPRAFAVLDIEDKGPSLTAGNFTLRITNIGVLGNAFLDIGRSNDPSFECPPGSGHEMLNQCSLWIGGRVDDGDPSVSGAPLMEFRPTLDSTDHVRMVEFGRLGVLRLVDDDNDGRIDEEQLNDLDDDGDGEIDEDLGLFSQQLAVADYVDDRPEAVNFGYEGGEQHRPLGLSVHQEAYAWSVPGYQNIAGLSFTITNHGTERVKDIYVGLFADMDSKLRTDRAGHVNDKMTTVSYTQTFYEGLDSLTFDGIHLCGGGPGPCPGRRCFSTLSQTVPVVRDGDDDSGLPMVALVPLWHTTDPLDYIPAMRAAGVVRAPRTVSFRSSVFVEGGQPGQGGAPTRDADRYLAMQGEYPTSNAEGMNDYAVLTTCGPFPYLDPGQSIEVHAALVWGSTLDSLQRQVANAAIMERGEKFNRLPDYTGQWPKDYNRGVSGINGHEICLEPPDGVSFDLDINCIIKFPEEYPTVPDVRHFTHGQCIWTDLDCNACTGIEGYDYTQHWFDPGTRPPSPSYTLTSRDHAVEIRWDNLPEILLNARLAGYANTRFIGYRVWKLYDWRVRPSLVPEKDRWALLASFGADTAFSGLPISAAIDSSVDYDRILYEQKHYPVGHYHMVDHEPLNGFDYIYVVTTVYENTVYEGTFTRLVRSESPLDFDFGARVVPHAAARENASSVWVVPNPFRGSADWDRPTTYGDQLTRHIDFMGLPKAQSTIKIWTVAGDFVAQIDHDGSSGDGQAAWDLVSRNGQEIASGIYIFTVDSSMGRSTGRFVVVR